MVSGNDIELVKIDILELNSYQCHLLFFIINRNMSFYKVIFLNPTGLNVISKALIFVFLPFVENLTPLETTLIHLFCCIYWLLI